MLLLLFSGIGMFLSGGGGYSPSGSYSLSLGTGISFPFDDFTYGYLEFETTRYHSLELLEYTPRTSSSELSHHSSKLTIGLSAEFRVFKFLLKPGVYHIRLSQRVKDKYIEGSFIITDFIPLVFIGYGVKLSVHYPIKNRFRIGLDYKKEWDTIPSHELVLTFIVVFK